MNEEENESHEVEEEKVEEKISKSTTITNDNWNSLIAISVLILCALNGFFSRLYAVIRYESIIHEFDPWFNYRSTKFMTENGFYNFLNWFDERAWYPLGRIVGGTVYPGLMVTSGLIHWILSILHFPVHIREICVFLAPIFSGLTALAAYLLTSELWSKGAGLFAAAFIAIVPGYISRSVAGSYDNEGIAIFALLFTYFLWIKSLKTGSITWATCTALSYFYMVSAWGGYVYIINLIPLHSCCLLLMGRFSHRLYISYSTFYILGTLLSMQVPFVGFQPIRTSEHMAAAGTFALLQAVAFITYIQSKLSKKLFRRFLGLSLIIVAAILFGMVVLLTWLGYVAPWSGRFYSLWDTSYAKIHIPIIASVSEHQPTTWTSMFFDLHFLITIFPVGVFMCIHRLNDERIFIVLYAISASYFAGVMVRLILTLTPCVCITASICLSNFMETFLIDSKPVNPKEKIQSNENNESGKKGKKPSSNNIIPEAVGINFRFFFVMVMLIIMLLFMFHCNWVTSNAYSSPSVVLSTYSQDGSRQTIDDFREAYYWLRQNTADDARIMSWWDYGYQIAGMGNKTTLVDNNTWNNSHIALVGKAMSSNESAAYDIMKSLDVDYVLVIFGGVLGYSGDDINKFLWMVRIAEGEHPRDIKEENYFTPNGEFRVDASGSKILLNCLMYKLSYYRFGQMNLDYRAPPGYDRVRNAEIGNKNFKLNHLEEAFTSEHWLVRIYKIKKEANKDSNKSSTSKLKRKRSIYTKKVNKKGVLKNRANVKKGRGIRK
ncbi:hypothetical protein SNEBB_010160 [Seison nebaliae]|nr:hypothetical protein SNEBB_010160 [Seison nebaliae]